MNANSATAKPRGGKPAPKRMSPLRVSHETIARLTRVFKLLADESRLKILLALSQDHEMHVSALCEMLDQSQPAVSHHLTLMRLTGLVTYRRDGKNNYYRLESGYIRTLLEQVFSEGGNTQKQIQFDDFILAYRRAR